MKEIDREREKNNKVRSFYLYITRTEENYYVTS